MAQLSTLGHMSAHLKNPHPVLRAMLSGGLLFGGFSLAGLMMGRLIGHSGDMAGSDIMIGLIELPTYFVLQFAEVIFDVLFHGLGQWLLDHKMLTGIICSAVNGLLGAIIFAALRLAWLRFHRHEDVA